jgi:type IV secretory pathway VirB9-like protein
MAMDRFIVSLRALACAALAGAIAPSTLAAPPQSGEGSSPRAVDMAKAVQTVQPNTGGPAPSAGIVFLDVTPDTIVTIRTAQSVITRVALPEEAKQAICGDLFDPGTSTGSFVIDKSGTDVYIKPMNAKGQTNLFVKTESGTYNFDLVVVPAAQAHRVVNVNLPAYEKQIEESRKKARQEMEQERETMRGELQQEFDDRRRELEKESAAALAAEQRKLRADTDRKVSDLAARRFADTVMQGLTPVSLRERRAEFDPQTEVQLEEAYVIEGKVYVRYRVANKAPEDLTYLEPRIVIRGPEKDRPVAATVISSRGDFVVPGGEAGVGVMVFERPELERGERVVFVLRVEGRDRVLQMRLLEQA